MKKILSMFCKVCQEYNLIENGDKIAVGLSGGKDSLALLVALNEYKKYFFLDFEIIAIAIDLTNGKNDYSQLINFCKNLNINLEIVPSNVFEIVFDIRKEKNPCSLCANLRRGILNSSAKNLGCNKVALGHHKDDLIETFIISLFFEGRLSTFKPKSYLSRMAITVIRPLIYCDEQDILKISQSYPVLSNNCPANKHTQREDAKLLLDTLNKKYLNCKEKIFNAIIHKERYNLFDKI